MSFADIRTKRSSPERIKKNSGEFFDRKIKTPLLRAAFIIAQERGLRFSSSP
jgi:hypothetical protein